MGNLTTLNFNTPIFRLDGQPIEDSNLGKIIGNSLATSNKGDAIKYFHWGCDFHAGRDVHVDNADLIVIRDFIKASEVLTNLTKAQALELIEKQKSE